MLPIFVPTIRDAHDRIPHPIRRAEPVCRTIGHSDAVGSGDVPGNGDGRRVGGSMASTTFAAAAWHAWTTARRARTEADARGTLVPCARRRGFGEMFVRSSGVGARIFGKNIDYAFYIAWGLAISFDPVLFGASTSRACCRRRRSWVWAPRAAVSARAARQARAGADAASGLRAAIAAVAVAGVALLGVGGMGRGEGSWGAVGATLSGLALALLVSAWLERFMRQGPDSVIWNNVLGPSSALCSAGSSR